MDLKYSPTKMERSMTALSTGWRKIVMAPSHVKIIALLSLFSSLFLLRTLLTNHELTSDSSYIVTTVSSSPDTNSSHRANSTTSPNNAQTNDDDNDPYNNNDNQPGSSESSPPSYVVPNDIIDATNNGTLGFAKIFYISLPYRSDRQDGMELLAKTTNMTLTYQPAAIGKNINEKAKPQKEGADLKAEQWGCWRSHVDLWRKIVEENIESALIMEDDLDWDVNIHDIMHRLSTQLRTGGLRKTKMTKFEETSAPYGLDWDTLHLGTCFDFTQNPLPKNIKYDDPHSPGRKDINGVYLSQLERVWHIPVKDSTAVRIIYPAWNPVCTIGYAVTQRGAQRLLYNVGLQPLGDPVDVAMLLAMQQGLVKGYSVIPPPLTTWKVGGARDSDIDDVQEQKNKGLFMEGSMNLRNSARKAMAETYGSKHEDLVGPIDPEEARYHAEKEKIQKEEDEKWQAEEDRKKKIEEEKKKKEEEEKKKIEEEKKKKPEDGKTDEERKKEEEEQKRLKEEERRKKEADEKAQS